MSIYKIINVIVDITTSPPIVSAPQEAQLIDTEENELYRDCVTIRDVEMKYEEFWNYINFNDIVHNRSQKVKVLSVERVSGPVPDSQESEVHKQLTKYHLEKDFERLKKNSNGASAN